jgi:hypothetical protein
MWGWVRGWWLGVGGRVVVVPARWCCGVGILGYLGGGFWVWRVGSVPAWGDLGVAERPWAGVVVVVVWALRRAVVGAG